MLVKLQSGHFDYQADDPAAETSPDKLDRRALLVYCGEFESVDGPVSIKPEHIAKLAENHNSALSKLARLTTGQVALKHCPPIQLDHSLAAKDTIGRLIGNLEVGEHIRDDGQAVPALFGTLRILGKENTERVRDGRWTHLSIGADLDLCKFRELTVTPFPAASDASMLSKTTTTSVKLSEDKGEESPMDKAKLKKYLTGTKKMSDEDADKHLAKCEGDDAEMKKLSAEVDEHEKKLSSETTEGDDKDKEEKEKKDKEEKLSAARTKLTQLSTDFRKNQEGAKLAAAKGKILTRLGGLRASAKITPAEIKKLDLDKLAKLDPAALDIVMGTYDGREPQVITGLMGNANAVDVAKLSDAKRRSDLENESRKNMSLLSKTVKKDVRLMDGVVPELQPEQQVQSVAAGAASDPMAAVEEICKMMDMGRIVEAKEKLKALIFGLTQSKTPQPGAAPVAAEAAPSTEEHDKQLSALAESVTQMQNQFEELSKLTEALVGGDDKEGKGN